VADIEVAPEIEASLPAASPEDVVSAAATAPVAELPVTPAAATHDQNVSVPPVS
jgi:hypothetical protein